MASKLEQMKRGLVGSSLHLSVCIRACILYVCMYMYIYIYMHAGELLVCPRFGLRELLSGPLES